MPITSRVSGVVIALLGCLWLAACSAPTPQPPLRIALNAWPGYEFLSLADELGYFKAEGVAVELRPFQTLADGRRALEKEQVDAMGGTLMELYTIRDTPNINPAIFLVADYSNGSDVLLVRKDIHSIAQLAGRRVGLELGTVDVLTAANALSSANLTFRQVQLVSLPQPEGVKALLQGRIDALQTYPPFSVEAMADPDIHPLFDTSRTPETILDVLIARRASLEQRPADYAAVARAFYRARAYYRDHPEEAAKRMAKRENISAQAFRDAMQGIRLIEQDQQAAFFSGHKLPALLNKTHQSLNSIGAISGPPCGQECLFPAAIAPDPTIAASRP